jgi:hypothetical protein
MATPTSTLNAGWQERKKFLRGSDIKKTANELINRATSVRVAIAYWGHGSYDWLDTGSIVAMDTTIVCDLMSGACDPDEILRLQNLLGKSRVLKRDRLHAKVWLTDQGAIVGSSNISANGLGWEGDDELHGSIEANVIVDDTVTLSAIRSWFESEVMTGATEITKEDFKEAHRRHKHHRITRPHPHSNRGSLLDAIRLDPAAFADRDFIVWIYSQGTQSAEAGRIIAAEQRARQNHTIEAWEDVIGPIPPAGALVLDFDLATRTRRASLDGLWQTLHDDPLVKKSKNGNVLLCRPVKKLLGLPLGDRKSWEKAATKAAADGNGQDEWSIADFSRKYLA